MKTEEIKELFEQFESIANEYEGIECWSARELCGLLGYSKWEKFYNVIEKARDACVNAGEHVEDHFPRVGKMIDEPLVIQEGLFELLVLLVHLPGVPEGQPVMITVRGFVI